MLKGHVFSKQLFCNPIFALFTNTFLNGKDGVSDNYKNCMEITYSGSNITVSSGAICIQGRFLEEDTSTTISAGTDNSYCKLVIEIDLDKTNTESNFQQGAYKIIKGSNDFPNLTQTNIVNNNAGVYQYELARFRNTINGITEFEDRRTFINTMQGDISVIEGTMVLDANTNENLQNNQWNFTAKTINYPSGYNKSNCIVLAFGTVLNDAYINGGYAFGDRTGGNIVSSPMVVGDVPRNASLFSDGIHIWIGNFATSQKTYKYKIVLMRTS